MKAKELEWKQVNETTWTTHVAWLHCKIVLDIRLYRFLVNGFEVHSSYDLYNLQRKAQNKLNELGQAIYQGE